MTEDSGARPTERIEELDIEEELKGAYLTYAMSVIIQRALPDVRDGLKPSQRRILVAMHDLGLAPRGRFLKCAKIAGDTSGNYHPHGESAIYPTLVRLAQPWNVRHRLIDGQGNFGSPDGDPPAAMRYTEARLTTEAVELMEDLDKDTVEFVANFDGRLQEPTVLPSKFPNLLVNGSSGIAVGMATSLPPHNLGEVIDALKAVVANPAITVREILEILPGPDFPTGGIICGRGGIRSAYETGRGLITIRSRTAIEEEDGRARIAVTEVPYQLTKTKLIEAIVDQIKAERITGIGDVRDESDQKGQRLVIEVKRGEDPALVLNQLYKYTPLQSTFSIINIALVDGRPRTLTIKELLVAFVRHRFTVIRRRTAFLLAKAEARAHILEGLLRALAMIDEIIAAIKASASPAEAGRRLMDQFGFTEPQATHIRQMQLQALTGLERERLQAEYEELVKTIARLRRIMAEDGLVYDVMVEEWEDLRKRCADARRTTFAETAEEIEDEDLIPEDRVVVTITREGYLKRTSLAAYRLQGRGGIGVRGLDAREGDVVRSVFVASTHDYVLFFTNQGRIYWLKAYQLPDLDRASRGRAAVNLLNLRENERVAQALCLEELSGGYLIFATRQGVVKRTALEAYSRPHKTGIHAILLDEGDELIAVQRCGDDDDIMLVTRNGQANRFAAGDARPMGRTAHGVRGIALRGDDRLVSLAVVREGLYLYTVCSNGYGKRTAIAEYPRHRRGGGGVRDIRTSGRNGTVVAAQAVADGDHVMLITVSGQVIRAPVTDVSAIGRGTMGVRVIRLREGDVVASLERISAEDLAAEAAAERNGGEEERGRAARPPRAAEHGDPFDVDDEAPSETPSSEDEE
ncbi:MAG: DNA gyrase subunit A [Planctomycetes bacterium]|jgi:DNA gyrase subunit A|nr:DNA gyrase subunit A [Planctomycetota bacterium]OQC21092.1 MAG: DNA gyrase subunit A [Planctomycetes bacterium ADurb.Bin069]HNV47419.1 DNA gyrase subunit A [Spirochaetota bacterium]NMD34651.1 DNA gyrase subunit A [Planctomycetota bacterium]HNU27292.1 DNA gyrase subunit A [Planctomycetota bacterium]